MSKKERFVYRWDEYDCVETIRDTIEYEECDSMQMATNWLNKQNQQMADLKAKLTESENRVKDLEFRNKNLEHSLKVAPNANAGQRARIVELKEINHKLKQQLAEKDKEIKKLKQLVKAIDTYNQYSNDAKKLILVNPDNCYVDGHQAVFKTNDQDKIDFAVEQLEQLRHDIWTNQQDDGYTDMSVDLYSLNDTIDVRIMQIKEGK